MNLRSIPARGTLCLVLAALAALAAPLAARQSATSSGPPPSPFDPQLPQALVPGTILQTATYPTNGHVYQRVEATSWAQARGLAEFLGGHLAVINDAAENAFLASTFSAEMWIGLTDQVVEGNHQWINGDPMVYINFDAGQPDDWKFYQPDGEDFFYMRGSGFWNDIGDKDPYVVNVDALVEIPAVPPAATPISVSNGGTAIMHVFPGRDLAGAPYLMIGSATGTSPGATIDGLHLPLVPDAYFVYTIAAPNQPPLLNSFGLLDEWGYAEVRFVAPPATNPAQIGTQLHHAAIAIDLGGVFPVVGWISPAFSLVFTD